MTEFILNASGIIYIKTVKKIRNVFNSMWNYRGFILFNNISNLSDQKKNRREMKSECLSLYFFFTT